MKAAKLRLMDYSLRNARRCRYRASSVTRDDMTPPAASRSSDAGGLRMFLMLLTADLRQTPLFSYLGAVLMTNAFSSAILSPRKR